MDRADLDANVRALVTLPETNAPMVSCYLGITRGRPSRPEALEERVRNLQSVSSGRERKNGVSSNRRKRWCVLPNRPVGGVEVMNKSEALTRLGGIGCVLRFRLPEDMSPGAESLSSAV